MADVERRRRRSRQGSPAAVAGAPPIAAAETAAVSDPADAGPGVPTGPGADAGPSRDGGPVMNAEPTANAQPAANAQPTAETGSGPEPAADGAGPTPDAQGRRRATAAPARPGITRPSAPVSRPTSGARGRPTSGAGTGSDERETERGLRGLVGSGSSQVSVGAAMRARDAARPTAAQLAEAEARLVIVRRNWVPREELPRNR